METANQLAGEAAVRRFLDEVEPFGNGCGHLVIETVFGELYRRPGLSPRDRELVTLTALAAIGDTEKELLLHLGIAHRLGISPAVVVEAFVHLSAYAGFPRTLNAIAVAKSFYADQGPASAEEG
ncbi:carboxymuconolactone decarboxylase family protein [Streptomyces sp. NPDC097107]|uniref:carboxymuconolactone decarboxylase family protein n=1 Tax=Streptomyces sp. NPDC097107 TaxID=3366089 RepID=UPI003802AC78